MKQLSIGRALSALGILMATVAACGSEDLPSAGQDVGEGLPSPASASCATPREGCPCNEPGKTIECGHVERRSEDYVTCSMGYRTCGAGKWGTCEGSTITTKSITSLHPAALATSPTTCTDPCDPYCSQYADTPAGIDGSDAGMKVIDGGLTIDPGVVPGGAVSTGFTSNPGGLTSCTPADNLVTSGACTPPGLGQCQQDFHCDEYTNRCLWNGGPGYKDTTCSNVDLTIGAPCGASGSAAPAVPLCNRGTGTLPSGATITLHQTNAPANACTDLGPPTCTYVMPVALKPGQCATLTYCQNSPGTKYVYVNAGDPALAPNAGGPAVAECSDAPAGKRCQNNGAFMKTDGTPGCGQCASCNTTISGKVFDPSGYKDPSGPDEFGAPPTKVNNLPLAGISVFQPSRPLIAFSSGVTCDTCESLQSPYQAGTVTDAEGSFTLNNVSPGASGTVPIVVQSGRWRRKIHVQSSDLVNGGGIVACQDNPIKNGALRLPRSVNLTTDNPKGQAGVTSDMPQTALVVGDRESLECWVRKIGIADSEIRPRKASGNTARFQVFRTNGSGIEDGTTCSTASNCTLDTSARACISGKCVYSADYTSSNALGSKNFYANTAVMNEFTAALLPCDNNVITTASTYSSWKTNISSYLRLGGRLFMNHYTGEEFLMKGPAPLSTTALVSTWNASLSTPKSPSEGWIPIPSPPQALFASWMKNAAGATVYGDQTMSSEDPREHALKPGSAATEWISGQTKNSWDATHSNRNFSLSFSFETGVSGTTTTVGKDSKAVNCGVPGGTGRVIYNGMHVSDGRMLDNSNKGVHPTTASNPFPSKCSLDNLSSEEKALEYQFFQLTACSIGGAPPPDPPPPPPPLPVVDFVRDYQASCAPGTRPVWQFFNWQAIIPTATTQIQFRAATAATQAALPPSPPGAAPATVAIGTATATIPTGPPPAPQWASDVKTVEQNLVSQSNVHSDQWLRVYMRFVPDNTTTPYSAPSLTNWSQTYDCVPSE